MASNEEILKDLRKFETGATRNIDTEREDPEGFLAPEVIEVYIAFMHKNRFQKDGTLREADNWQKGIPQRAYMKSLWRHFFDLWKKHRENKNHITEEAANLERVYIGGRLQDPKIIEDCCAIMFNIMGYLQQELKKPEFHHTSRSISPMYGCEG